MPKAIIGAEDGISFPRNGAPNYNAIISSYNPTLRFDCHDLSGNLSNTGSGGVDAVVTGSPDYGVSGAPLGDAIRLNASPEKFTMPDNAIHDIALYTWIITFKYFGNTLSATSADGRIFVWGAYSLLVQNDRSLKWEVDSSTGQTSVTGAANQLGASFPTDYLTAVLVRNGTNLVMHTFGESIPFVTNTAAQSSALDPHNGVLAIGNNTGNTRQTDIELNGIVRLPFALPLAGAQLLDTAIYG